jgi:hypothetical protein
LYVESYFDSFQRQGGTGEFVFPAFFNVKNMTPLNHLFGKYQSVSTQRALGNRKRRCDYGTPNRRRGGTPTGSPL